MMYITLTVLIIILFVVIFIFWLLFVTTSKFKYGDIAIAACIIELGMLILLNVLYG